MANENRIVYLRINDNNDNYEREKNSKVYFFSFPSTLLLQQTFKTKKNLAKTTINHHTNANAMSILKRCRAKIA